MDIASQLEKLNQLHESNALSDEEFARAKKAVLVGTEDDATSVADNKRLTIGAHLLHRAPARSRPLVQDKSKANTATCSQEANVTGACAYGPVAPKLARLEHQEEHLHTFRITPYVYKQASIFPPRIGGWYPDCTMFVWHLTDRRLLIEPYEIGQAEGMVIKYLLILGQANLGGKIGGMAARQDWEAGQERLKKMDGQWLAIPYTDIAKVEQQELPPYQRLGAKLAKVTFKNEEVEPLVLGVAAAESGLFSLNLYGGPFISILAELVTRVAGKFGDGGAVTRAA